jgi:hypothetical protein
VGELSHRLGGRGQCGPGARRDGAHYSERMGYLKLTCRVTLLAAALWLAEIFDDSGRSFREGQLDFLRRSHADGSEFWDLIPAALMSRELTFEERRAEYEALGFVCAEVHRGNEQEMFESGFIRFCTNENREVIAARYKRQAQPTASP